MVELYILVYAMAGSPKVEVYSSEQQACVSYEAYKDTNSGHVYKVTSGKHDEPMIAEGECKPLQQFVTQK